MLKRLYIQNLVILKKQEIAFGSGLNVITGETGSGKSIMLGALRLTLGQRAESGVLFDKSRKAVIEAVFTDYGAELDTILQNLDIDVMEELILRREILPHGKSRAFVNDTPVKLSVMQDLSALLIDLHEQFESLDIQRSAAQITMLDGFAGNQELYGRFSTSFREMKKLEQDIAVLREHISRVELERDFTEFQLAELTRALEHPGTLEEWESEFGIQENAHTIQAGLYSGGSMLQSGEQPITDSLRTVHRNIEEFADSDRRIAHLAERLQSVIIELDDLAIEMESLAGEVEPDPERKAELESWIDETRKLLLKYNVSSDGELNAISQQLSDKLLGLTAATDNLETLEVSHKEARRIVEELATQLSMSRSEQGEILSDRVTAMLKELEMKNARFEISVEGRDGIGENGRDRVEFLFASNKGSTSAPVGKIASGGELSRLSLCLKSVIASKMDLPTLVFDEVDTGVSGQVAVKMGGMLRGLASSQQVIMITHSPQIAGYGQHHFKVYKLDAGDHSEAHVSCLSEQERIDEIAKMLSGDPPTEAAIFNARELII